MEIFVTGALRVKLPGHDTLRFIVDVTTMAALEAGLKTHIRVGMVREGGTLDFQTATTRAKRHKRNNLRTWPKESGDTSHVLATAANSARPQLAERTADYAAILTYFQSHLKVIRGERGCAEKRAPSRDRSIRRAGGESEKIRLKDNSVNSTNSDGHTSVKPKKSNPCEYAPCRYNNTYETADCGLMQSHVEFA